MLAMQGLDFDIFLGAPTAQNLQATCWPATAFVSVLFASRCVYNDVAAMAQEVKLFGKWSFDDVEVRC